MIIRIVLLSTVALLAICSATLAARKPNIVLILTDDLGYGDVSFLNPESKVQTPHMDTLAKEGVWATDAHAQYGLQPQSLCHADGAVRLAWFITRWSFKPVERIRH